MWWWGPGAWWPGFAVMVAFMLICGVFLTRMVGGRGTGGMCGWWRGREDADRRRDAEGARRTSDRDEQLPHDARPDRSVAR